MGPSNFILSSLFLLFFLFTISFPSKSLKPNTPTPQPVETSRSYCRFTCEGFITLSLVNLSNPQTHSLSIFYFFSLISFDGCNNIVPYKVFVEMPQRGSLLDCKFILYHPFYYKWYCFNFLLDHQYILNFALLTPILLVRMVGLLLDIFGQKSR